MGSLVAACGLISCSMHAGSSSPTRDWTQAPCIGSAGSYPLDHQGTPFAQFVIGLFSFFFFFNFKFFIFINLFILFYYLFLAALGLRCCARAFSSCGEQGLLFIAVPGFSLWWLLLLRSTGSRRVGFSSCGSQALGHRLSNCGKRAYLLCGMWDLPGPGLKPVSPALAGGFLTTVPPGKPWVVFLLLNLESSANINIIYDI